MGSGHLPFEQSKDLVEQFIEIIEKLVCGQVVFWTKRKLVAGRSKFHYTFERTDSDKEFKIRTAELQLDYGMKNPTLEDAVRKANETHIKVVLEPAVRQCDSYVSWQRERIQNWQPTELTPIN